MNRATATTYLTEEFRDLATDAGFTSQNTTDAYNTALDNALRQLGYAESDLPTIDVPETLKLAYIALMEYFTLKRFVRLYALQFNVTITGAVGANRSQKFDMLTKLLAEAEADCARLGYPVGGATGYFSLGRLDLDYLEPTPAGTEF